MRHITLLLIIKFLSAFINVHLFAQVDSVEVSKIKIYTSIIDSLSENENRQQKVVISLREGRITQNSTTTSKDGTKIDSSNKTIGGFSYHITQNISGDTVYKICYHDNLDKNYYETFYFKDNKLVLSKIDYQENGVGQTFYFREEYYKESVILSVLDSSKLIDSKYKERVTFDLKNKGYEYLQKFKANRM